MVSTSSPLLPLSDKENIFQFMNESQFNEGGALNTFGDTFDFEGKHFLSLIHI